MKEQYYLYEYKRQSPYIDKEEYLILTDKLINSTTKEKPIRLVLFNSELEELYKLIAILTLEEKETPDNVARDLSNNLNKKVKYKTKIYLPIDYQSKVGREVAAHRIDNNSNRISSYNRSLEKIEGKDKRDNIQAKVVHHLIKDNIITNKEKEVKKIANSTALRIAIKDDLHKDRDEIINIYIKLIFKRMVNNYENFIVAKIKAGITLINNLISNYDCSRITDVGIIEVNWIDSNIVLKEKKRIKVEELNNYYSTDFTKTFTYTYLKFNDLQELIKDLFSINLLEE